MALTVGELVAFLSLDSSQFEKGMSGAGKQFSGLRDTSEKVVSTMATGFAAGTTAIAGLTVGAMKTGVAYNSLQQSSRAALTTLLGSATAANAQMNKLDEFAKNSPFAKQVFIQAQQQLLAFGMEAKKVIPTLDAVQNAVASAGGSSQTLSEVVFVMAQIQAAGKITGQDLMQLGQRGIDAASLIGSTMGKSGAQIRAEITAGTLGATQALDALTAGMAAKFGKTTDLLKQQWAGATDRISAAWRDIGSQLAEPFVAKGGGGYAVQWANTFADGLRGIEKLIQDAWRAFASKLVPILNQVNPAMTRIVDGIKAVDMSKIASQFDGLQKYIPIVSGLSAAFYTMGIKSIGSSIPIIGQFATSLNPVMIGIAALVATSPQLRRVAADFITGLQPLVPVVLQVAKSVGDLAASVLGAATPALSALSKGATQVAGVIGPVLAGGITVAVNAITPLINLVGMAASVLDKLPAPVLAGATAFAGLVAMKGPISELFGTLSNSTVVNAAGMAFLQLKQNMSGIGAQAAELGGGPMNMLKAGAQAASQGIRSLGDSMKAAFASNWITLAIGAVVAALSSFWQAQQSNIAAAKELSDTFDSVTKSATEATKVEIAKKLQENIGSDTWKVMERLGISIDQVRDALYEGGDASDAMRARLDEARLSVHGFNRDGERVDLVTRKFDNVSKQMDMAADMADTNAQAMKGLSSETDGLASSTDKAAQAEREAQAAAADQALALGYTGDVAAATTEQLDAYTAAQEKVRESTAQAGEKFIDIGGAFESVNAKAIESAKAQADAAGKGGDAWLDYYQTTAGALDGVMAELDAQIAAQQNWAENVMKALALGMSTSAIETLQAMGPAGQAALQEFIAGTPEDQAALKAKLEQATSTTVTDAVANAMANPKWQAVLQAAQARGEDTYMAVYDAMVSGTGTIESIAAQYGLIVEGVTPQLQIDIANAEQKIVDIDAQLAQLDATSADPTVRANISELQAARAEAVRELDELNGKTPTPKFHADPSSLDAKLAMAEANMVQLESMQANPKFNANDQNFQSLYRQTNSLIHDLSLQSANPTIRANNSQAVTAIADVQSRLDNVRSKEVSLTVRQNIVAGPAIGGVSMWSTGGQLPGPPSSRDNMLIAAASGEFIVRAAQASKHRALLEAINSGTLPGYATGGTVGAQPSPSPSPSQLTLANPNAIAEAILTGLSGAHMTLVTAGVGAREAARLEIDSVARSLAGRA